MRKICIALFVIAAITLLLELVLMRVFDVILTPNISYLIITCSLLCFGLAGIYSSIFPFNKNITFEKYISRLAFLFGVSTLIILPAMNLIPFDLNKVGDSPLLQISYFLLIYLFIAMPFFFVGLIFSTIFSIYPLNIQKLYFWDLTGAGVGCIILIPFISSVHPGGMVLLVGAIGLLISASFAGESVNKKVYASLSLVIFAFVLFVPKDIIEFKNHQDKRGVKEAKEEGRVEMVMWDPIAKIDVINFPDKLHKHVAYDGGNQSSLIYPFDGDYGKLRKSLPGNAIDNFWFKGVLFSHYLKRDSNQDVLILGSAAGQETKAALTYGAGSVDAVEMVPSVVKISKEDYSEFNGNIFNHPNVNCVVGEGRSFLRSSEKKYDIIQIFSNHTSSSIASGTGAMQTTYLQTAEAYSEYFSKLKKDGILQVNHKIYTRMITTASLGWKMSGREKFQDHVLVIERTNWEKDDLPTFLVKMEPWTIEEIDELKKYYNAPSKDTSTYGIVINPLDHKNSFLSEPFFSGEFPDYLKVKSPYRVYPSIDDRPYFNFLRKKIGRLNPDNASFLNSSTAGTLNSQLTQRKNIPMDISHLIVTGIASIIFSVLFVVVPLLFSKVGRSRDWTMKRQTLLYFACLGSGFIILELVFIQIFMKLIGSPLYTYSTIIFVLLISAGIGSFSSQKFNISLRERWYIPFVGVLLAGIAILLIYPYVFNIFLSSSLLVRILISIIMIFPLGFFLGMPFPLGILAIEKQPEGAIAWAWGINGLFTVIGGFLTVVISLFFGFKFTITIALSIYLLAFLIFSKIRLADQSLP